MTSLAIILASCWVLGGATVTQDGQLHSNIGINDKIFTYSIVFESTAANAGQCALQCNQQDSCATFTFHQNTCRGHGVPMSLGSPTQSAPGARSFAKNSSSISTAICAGTTGVQNLADTFIGLNKDVYCDDGWLVFQKRQDGSVDFNRNWDNYAKGFGDVNGEHWLGLELLSSITSSPVNYEMRVDLMKFDGTSASAFYSNFVVGPAADKYRMDYDSFQSATTGAAKLKARSPADFIPVACCLTTAVVSRTFEMAVRKIDREQGSRQNDGDSMSSQRGMQFTTPDADHDASPANCAELWKGSWWYNACSWARLNGIYETSRMQSSEGVFWYALDGINTLKSCQMMIRPAVN